MNRQIWFNKAGEPIDAGTANDLLGDRDYARVALARVTSSSDPGIDYRISTVWLGLNHSFLGDGPPILFETMVFGGGEDQDQTCWRWTTEAAAVAGHAEVVATIAATVPDDQVRALDGWPVNLTKEQQ
ncbi:hypothetical protein QMK19_03430 [Streptomyces sp. H10-C2]|uniref:hypothetical protein n=1 Tax=unclassified Streptomyces TaxID=2593676 RepID=UPI0024B952E1|nr:MULTISPECIES: hypothetical protein [unclassified Streptomyces]MDJ0342238.1 hypothetical protein [Streptomyces sp. PH10-H1]MDJ0368752.1 hypothetical protein [Streptomyces sp. H10-C2]